MIEAAKQGVKRTKKVLSWNLLRGLRKRRMGTPAVEKMAKNLMEERWSSRLRKTRGTEANKHSISTWVVAFYSGEDPVRT